MKRMAAVLAGLVLAGCNGVTDVGLSVRATNAQQEVPAAGVTPEVPAAGVEGGAAPSLPAGLELLSVKLAVREVVLRKAGESGRGDTIASNVVIDLSGDALAGKLHEVLQTPVAAGVYDKLKVKIDGVEVHGVLHGQAFHFAKAVELEFERETHFAVGEGSNNLTLSFDPVAWFRSVSGGLLDPGAAADLAAILANIHASFDCFDDSDHDGRDDHRGRGSDDGAGDDHGGRRDGGGHGADDPPGDDHGGNRGRDGGDD